MAGADSGAGFLKRQTIFMQREIKFRGKRKDNGEWVTGYLIDQGYILAYIDLAQSWESGFDSDHKVTCRAYEIIPGTVGQFVCNDRNRQPVFEGDILLMYSHSDITHKHEPGKVWHNGKYNQDKREVKCSCGTFYTMNQTYRIEQAFLHMARPGQSFEVIGNIHENAEQHQL